MPAARLTVRPLLAVLLLLTLAAPGSADSLLQRRRSQQADVREELQEKRTRLMLVRRQERRALQDLEAMDRRREAAEARLRSLEAELRWTRARAQATATSLAVVKRRLAGQRIRVNGRLRDIYKWGRRGYVDVLLDVADFSEFVTRAHFLSTIMQADTRLLEEYAAEGERYARLHRDLVAEQERIARLIAQTVAHRAEITQQANAKHTLVARIQRERALYEQVIRELEQTDRELLALIRRLQAAQPPGARLAGRFGNFTWPSRGIFTSGFGIRRHPIFRVRRMHSGVDIAAPRGAPVVAAWDGSVIFSGWFGGYGKIVVIDHGDGVSTLYAHLSAILAGPGERVRKGELIGRVGSTGYSTGPHIHFEIRINGTPIDPAAP